MTEPVQIVQGRAAARMAERLERLAREVDDIGSLSALVVAVRLSHMAILARSVAALSDASSDTDVIADGLEMVALGLRSSRAWRIGEAERAQSLDTLADFIGESIMKRLTP